MDGLWLSPLAVLPMPRGLNLPLVDQIRTAMGLLQEFSRNGQGPSNGSQRLDSDVLQQVEQLLRQGYWIGIEHADRRRYRSGVWQSGIPIESTRELDVVAALESYLDEHSGEYVRMIGIDPKAKRRVLETTIQKP